MAALLVSLAIAAMALVGLMAVHHDRLRRVLLTTVDPRPLALFRIALGLCLLSHLIEFAPVSLYLFSDEGLLPSAAVPQVYGRGTLDAYGDGVRNPAGFFGVGAAVQYLATGRWSLLYFWDSPAFVRGTLVVLGLSYVGIVIGWRTRACTVVAWLLFNGLLRRGDAHWGGEQVFTGLLFILMFARCGDAFSVDAWRRARGLARQGRLDRASSSTQGRGAPPSAEHPEGLAAIYPRVPAWPQALLLAQLALCYCVNGWTKSGSTWISGDTLRLAVHLDRYARLDWHALAVAVGPWPFRLATWSVMWWERLFPLVLVGLWLRATERSGGVALSRRARSIARLCWLALAAAALTWALTPGVLAKAPPVAQARSWALGAGASAVVLGVLLGPRLWPRARERVLRLLDPRWWLGFGLLFHGTSLVLFEIGAFASATISVYVLAGLGPMCVEGIQRVARALGRRGLPVPEHLRCPHPVRAAVPRPMPANRAVQLPAGAIAVAGIVILGGAALALSPIPGTTAWWHGSWLLAAAGLLAVGATTVRRSASRSNDHARGAANNPAKESADDSTNPSAKHPGLSLAYGPAGRLAAGGLIAYHLVALLAWQLPAWPRASWRDGVRGLVDPWMELSFTRHLWSMFGPNGPRADSSLRTTIIDQDGHVHDLRTEQQHPKNLPRPYLRHDRWRKVYEAVGRPNGRLTRWHARYLCRHWAWQHDGRPPAEVRLERVMAPFPPMRPLDTRAWFWSQAKVRPLVQIQCAEEPFAQLAPELRERHGLPPAKPGELRYAWLPSPRPSDPLGPLWMMLALGLGGAIGLWSRHLGPLDAAREQTPQRDGE